MPPQRSKVPGFELVLLSVWIFIVSSSLCVGFISGFLLTPGNGLTSYPGVYFPPFYGCAHQNSVYDGALTENKLINYKKKSISFTFVSPICAC